ncbi:uncharacterized protein LOC119912716 [Micropterus salmoides]|uniref:uncharacterized protein LOC119912716 n=1 Tax=Micropterus salmoides TaxID=27706 RepID=UPI0018EB5D71|nr:uncharacterized protein LOC119912716 [Micropterus salmoides]
MAALTFVVLFSFSWIFVLAKIETQELKVDPGEDATLECRVRSRYMESDLHWMRTKPWLDRPLMYFRVNMSFERFLDPSFRGRVELKDPELKDGNFSVILKNVTINDAGTYECDWAGWRCFKYRIDPFSIIILSVTGQTAGNISAGENQDKVIKDREKMDEGKKFRGNKDVRKAEGNRSFLHSREHVGLVVDVLLGALLVAVVVAAFVVFRFIICRKYKVLTEINSY